MNVTFDEARVGIVSSEVVRVYFDLLTDKCNHFIELVYSVFLTEVNLESSIHGSYVTQYTR